MRRIYKTIPFSIFESLYTSYIDNAYNGLSDLATFQHRPVRLLCRERSSTELSFVDLVVVSITGTLHSCPFSRSLYRPLLFLLSPCRSTPSRSLCRSPLHLLRSVSSSPLLPAGVTTKISKVAVLSISLVEGSRSDTLPFRQ